MATVPWRDGSQDMTKETSKDSRRYDHIKEWGERENQGLFRRTGELTLDGRTAGEEGGGNYCIGDVVPCRAVG